MAKKISELNVPSLPLSGTELIEMSQSSISVKVTSSELTSDVLGGIGSFDGTTFTIIGDIVCNDITIASETLYIGTDAIIGAPSGNLEIGPVANPDALKYDTGTNRWLLSPTGGTHITRGDLTIGIADTDAGTLTLTGNDSQAGGEVTLQVGAAYDTTINSYALNVWRDDLQIGPATDPDALNYDGGLNLWQFTRSETRFGTEDSIGAAALLTLYSDNSTDGGRIQLHTGPAYDTTITHYHIGPFEDDLYIGPATDLDALKYDGLNNLWQFTIDETRFGTEDAAGSGGLLTVYGDNSGAGGRLQLHLGAGYDTTIPHYEIRGWEDDLYIGPSTDTNSLKYDGGLNLWQFTRSETRFGTEDDAGSPGTVVVYGSNSIAGGEIHIHTGAPYDTTITHYEIRSNEDDLLIGPATDLDALKYDGALSEWQFTVLGGPQIVVGQEGVAAGEGVIHMYGDDSNAGPKLRMYVPPAYDTTIDYYELGITQDAFFLNSAIGLKVIDYDPSVSEELAFRYSATAYMSIADNGQEFFMNLGGNQVLNLADSGALTIGSIVDSGSLWLTGDPALSTTGGKIVLYVAADHDTTIDYYAINVDADDLRIGPFTDPDALKYDGGLNQWQLTPAGGVLINDLISPVNIGALDSTGGIEINLFVDPDYDTTIDNYTISTFEDDLYIGPSTDPDSLKYDGGLNKWLFTGAGGINTTGNISIDSGNLDVGVTGVQRGKIDVQGHATGSDIGGIVDLDTALDYTLIGSYRWRIVGNNMELGPNTDYDALKYEGATNQWQLTPAGGVLINNLVSPVSVGTTDTTSGVEIILYVDTDYDTTIDSYHIQTFEDDLYIGPVTDTDALKYDGTLNMWQFTRDETRFGTEDFGGNGARLTIYGGNSNKGGEIEIHVGAAYDTTIAYYEITPFEDDLHIGPVTDTDALKYDGGLNRWITSATGGFDFGVGATSLIAGIGDVINFGIVGGVRYRLDHSDDQEHEFYDNAGALALKIDQNGIRLNAVGAINEFSTDGTLGDNSDSALPTEQAVKTYVDAKSGQTAIAVDSTSIVVSLDATSADIAYYPVCTIENRVDASPLFLNFYISAKTTTDFTVTFSEAMDTGNYKLNWRI